MKHFNRRLLASLLVCAIVLAVLPVGAVATGDDDRWQNRGMGAPTDSGGPTLDVGPTTKGAVDSAPGGDAVTADGGKHAHRGGIETTITWASLCAVRLLTLEVLRTTALLP